MYSSMPIFHTYSSITYTLGEYPFSIYLSSVDDKIVRSWIQQLARPDGSYIVRYKIYKSFTDLKIVIQYAGQNVASAPYMLKGK